MRFLRPFASRRARVVLKVLAAAGTVALGALLAWHFAEHGWPLAGAKVPGVLAAGGLFVAAFAFKAWGWQQLFNREARPTALVLAAAGGAASVTGLALPGRCDTLVRIAVVRRYRGKRGGLGSVLVSLFTLGLIDNAALVPFAAVAAAFAAPSGLVRLAFIVVACAGLLAAVAVHALPRLSAMRHVVRFRLGGKLAAHAASPRRALKAWLFVVVSWTLRGAALLFLLDAVALGGSFSHALVFLCASAAATALPIAPQGAAAQAGAGAAVLGAAGVSVSQAVAFAIAAQALLVLAGATIIALALLVHFSARLLPGRAAASVPG
jgi:hypothetical protein